MEFQSLLVTNDNSVVCNASPSLFISPHPATTPDGDAVASGVCTFQLLVVRDYVILRRSGSDFWG
jgi:hypothetical protein